MKCSLSLLVVGFLFAIQTATPSFAAYNLWVATNGSDSADGSQATPWATIGQARDYIRANPALTNSDITVNISNGTYVLTSALTFTNDNDSGRAGYYIIYKALNGPGTVNLVGSDDVNGWTLHSGNIYKVNIGAYKTIHTMYENGVRARLARSPNYTVNARYPDAHAPYCLSVAGGVTNVGAVTNDWLQYNPGEFSISNFTSTAKVTWWGYGGERDWGMLSYSLISNNATTRTLYFGHSGVIPGISSSDRYFVAGIQSFLDQAGEFYYSKTNGWLYYYARAGGDPTAQDVRVPLSTSTTLIAVTGSAPGTHIHHIKFEGLTLAYTSYGAEAGALDLQATDHIEVRNCHISNVGRGAIRLNDDNVSNLVYGCWIEHCGVGGIWVKNYLLRDDYPNNKSEYNIISNCKIHDLGELEINSLMTAGVLLFDTSDCEVSFCDIYNSGRYAISLRGHWSTQYGDGLEDNGRHFAKNNTFKYIRATDCMQDSGDGGIMHAAHCNGSGDPLGQDNINYWKDILISGAYADPSMHDWAPNGIFFDHPYSCLYQNLSNIQIDWVQASNDTNHPSNTGAYRGNSNPIESQTTSNVSFTGTFNESLMDYANIGLKPDFPFSYDSRDTLISDDHTLDYAESDTSWADSSIGSLSKGDGRYHNSGSSSNFARWLPIFPFTRKYDVSIWKMGNSASASTSAPYTVYYQGGSQNVTVNQQTGTGGWVSVGTYPFAAGCDATNGAVKLFANTADSKAIRADAVKFTEVGLLTNGVLGAEKGWWGFENTGADASGFGHTATIYYVSYSVIPAVGAYSAFFNGTNAYASVADHQDLDIGTGDFSITLWFRRDANAATNLRILSKGAENDTDKGYSIWGSNTSVTFALCDGTSRRMLTGSHLGTNAWNNLAVNISRTGYMTLYINGVEAREMNISDWNGLDLSNARNLNIGRSVTSGTLYWPGRIDELSVFQRVLSDNEIGL